MSIARSLPGFALATVMTAVTAAPPNDHCDDAEPITGEGIFHFDNTDATMDGLPACTIFGSPADIPSDVWFCWLAPRLGNVTIETCGGTTVDTKIAVYIDCDCPTRGYNACNDDACATQSRLTFEALENVEYGIRIGTRAADGVSGGTGTFAIRYDVPTGPICDADPENCQSGNQADGRASNGTDLVVADNFTLSVDGYVRHLCWRGTYFDGTADCLPVLQDAFEVRYYLDGGGVPGPLIAGPFANLRFSLAGFARTTTGRTVNGGHREWEFNADHEPVPVVAGECYWIEITNTSSGDCIWYWETANGGDGRAIQDGRGANGRDGYDPSDLLREDMAFCLDVPLALAEGCVPSPPLNDECTGGVPIFEGETFFDTSGATTDGPPQECWYSPPGTCCDFPLGDETVHKDIWFDYVASCSGTLTAGICDSIYDNKIAVYSGLECPPLDLAVACNDDSCTHDPAFLPPVASSVGQGGVGGTEANSDCFFTHPSTGCDNESCASVVCGTHPSCCESRWHFECVSVARDSCRGSDCLFAHDTPGCDDEECAARVCVDAPFCCESLWYPSCAEAAAVLCPAQRVPGLQAEVSWRVTRGQSYKIRVGGYRGAAGTGTLSLGYASIPPSNADLLEFASFAPCFTGACITPPCEPALYAEPCCVVHDYERDGDVDIDDYSRLITALTGP